MVSIGIIGIGSVGSAVMSGMQEHHDIVGYDIDGRGDFNDILKTDVVMVCVPTDGHSSGTLDMSAINATCEKLNEDEYRGLIIIKSTIPPGTMDSLENKYPNLRLCYMPEFLREKDAYDWFVNPDRLIVSGANADCVLAFKLFDWVAEKVPKLQMRHLDAEIGKLAHNAYIATKVTFTCEMERLCKQLGANPFQVMEVVWRDRRVLNSSHLTPGLGGFDGKCVPKDTKALHSVDDEKDNLLEHVLRLGGAEAVKERLGGKKL